MTKAEVSKRYRERQADRQRAHKNLSNARRRNAPPGKIKALEIKLKEIQLNKCPKCGDNYRNHGRPNGDCIGLEI